MLARHDAPHCLNNIRLVPVLIFLRHIWMRCRKQKLQITTIRHYAAEKMEAANNIAFEEFVAAKMLDPTQVNREALPIYTLYNNLNDLLRLDKHTEDIPVMQSRRFQLPIREKIEPQKFFRY